MIDLISNSFCHFFAIKDLSFDILKFIFGELFLAPIREYIRDMKSIKRLLTYKKHVFFSLDFCLIYPPPSHKRENIRHTKNCAKKHLL